jgi:hypothetical protein
LVQWWFLPAGRSTIFSAGGDLGRALLVGIGHDCIGVGDVELAVEQGHAEWREQPGEKGGFGFCHPVAVLIAQQRNAIGGMRPRAGLRAIAFGS